MSEDNPPLDLSEVRSRGRATCQVAACDPATADSASVGDVIWCVEYQHKHGTDFAIHITEYGALLYAKSICVDYIGDWVDCPDGEHVLQQTPEELLENWSDITGGCEFIIVDRLRLNR